MARRNGFTARGVRTRRPPTSQSCHVAAARARPVRINMASSARWLVSAPLPARLRRAGGTEFVCRSPPGFEPLAPQPRLIDTQAISRPRQGVDKSGCDFQGEVRHECTKQTLARLRPRGPGDPGRGYRRGGIARAEHLIRSLQLGRCYTRPATRPYLLSFSPRLIGTERHPLYGATAVSPSAV